MKKKLMAMLLACVMTAGLLSLSACGGSGETSSPDDSANAAVSESPAVSEPSTASDATEPTEPSESTKPSGEPTGELVASGEIGEYSGNEENVTWSLYDDGTLAHLSDGTLIGNGTVNGGTLVISGTGLMRSFTSMSPPWVDYLSRCEVTTIVIKDGITNIGGNAFYGCFPISIIIPASVTDFGYGVFRFNGIYTDIYYGGSEDQWNQIYISGDNDGLADITVHYDS